MLTHANLNRLTVPHCRLSTYGCQAFYHVGPTVWNSLPDELRNSDGFVGFKRFLKTTLFSRYCVISTLEVYNEMRYINLRFTYLLTCTQTGSFSSWLWWCQLSCLSVTV